MKQEKILTQNSESCTDFDRVILIDKPDKMSSFGVVARVRRKLTASAKRKIKVGHTGTLDPFATGLMILLSGKFTRRANEFSKLDKIYEAEFILGKTSSTGDPEGEITEEKFAKIPQKNEVEKVIRENFLGEITQTPPIFSAIKINGERAYKLARRGENFAIPSRKVQIFALEILRYDFPILKIRAHVSSGTYIRTLAEDIGKKLKTGAYCTQLRRTKIGQFSIENSVKLTDFMENFPNLDKKLD